MKNHYLIFLDDDDEEEVCEYPTDYMILDDYDFALIGCKRARKRCRMDSECSDDIQYVPEVISNLQAIMLRTE